MQPRTREREREKTHERTIHSPVGQWGICAKYMTMTIVTMLRWLTADCLGNATNLPLTDIDHVPTSPSPLLPSPGAERIMGEVHQTLAANVCQSESRHVELQVNGALGCLREVQPRCIRKRRCDCKVVDDVCCPLVALKRNESLSRRMDGGESHNQVADRRTTAQDGAELWPAIHPEGCKR